MSEIGEAERTTRRQRIDPQLEAAGWRVRASSDGESGDLALREYPTANGPADYALVCEGRIVGVVEAKRAGLAPDGVVEQAQRYAEGLPPGGFDFGGVRAPFLYSTNGVAIRFRDARNPLNLSRDIDAFHTPAALQELLNRDFDSECAALRALPNTHERLRPYQRDANEAIESAIAGRKRQMLVAMATGTGKTFTMVNQVYRLMKSGVARRVLFLVDRRALAAQAVREFASFDPEPGLKFDKIYEVYSQRFQPADFDESDRFDPKMMPRSYLTEPVYGAAFVYVCTIQRMMINLFGRGAIFEAGDEEIDEDADKIDIPIHAFDLVIADECHRGYTSAELSRWRATLDHFDAIKVGLTATPASHTTSYFKDVVYRYEYRRAVEEGYLVDYDAVRVHSDIRVNGVFLREGEQVGVVNTDTGARQMDLLEDERQFDSSQIEEKVTAPDSNRRILEEVQRYALEHEREYGRFPKTLIFAQNDLPHRSHADQLVNLGRELFGRGEEFVTKITGKADRPLQAIREFRNRPDPKVVVSVDLMSTGVDIPNLEFIVFLRFVKSRILFEQMLGRGTRKSPDLPDKSHFTIFDGFDGTLLEYFRDATAITEELPTGVSKPIAEVIKAIWDNRDRDYNIGVLVKRLQRIDKEMSGEARGLFAAHVPNGDLAGFARSLRSELLRDFTGTMGLLRDPGFQDLLERYPRHKDPFIIAYNAEDTVSSEWLIRDGAGNEYRPEDYLAAFARFVRENPMHVEAIAVLLDRPREWSYAALKELRLKLAAAPERFSEENLERAHERGYGKALVDIISMVKRAAREEAPLLTAEERADGAVARLTAGREFSEEQRQWLQRIRDHLAANLSIDRTDFEVVPVLADAGGWGRADRVFDGRLEELVRAANEAVAA